MPAGAGMLPFPPHNVQFAESTPCTCCQPCFPPREHPPPRAVPSAAQVCGCGLDTVPVPGVGPDTPAEEAEALLTGTAAVLLDVAALSARLRKPLSARLLPVPGRRAGERTAFKNPYLVDCTIMEL